MSVHVFCPLSGLCYYYWVWDINLLFDMCFANIFTQICSLSFHRCFLTQESFKFWCHLHYQVLYLCIIILVSSLRILCLLLDSKDIFLYFFFPHEFYKFAFKFMSYSDLIFVQDVRFRFEIQIFWPWKSYCSRTTVEKSPSTELFLHLWKKKISWQNTIPSYEYIVFINLFITQWTFELLLHFGYYQ